jgi:hypothetical protein
MFPANIYAALPGLQTAWYDQVVLRTVMQGVLLAATLIVLVDGIRLRRADPQRWAEPGPMHSTRSVRRVTPAGGPGR